VGQAASSGDNIVQGHWEPDVFNSVPRACMRSRLGLLAKIIHVFKPGDHASTLGGKLSPRRRCVILNGKNVPKNAGARSSQGLV